MSTRATIHFCDVGKRPEDDKPTAIVYRHSDGYPDGLGLDLQQLINFPRETFGEPRFDDASVLAVRWIVFEVFHVAFENDRHVDKVNVIGPELNNEVTVASLGSCRFGTVRFKDKCCVAGCTA